MRKGKQVGLRDEGASWSNTRERVHSNVRGDIMDRTWDPVKELVADRVRNRVGDQFMDIQEERSI